MGGFLPDNLTASGTLEPEHVSSKPTRETVGQSLNGGFAPHIKLYARLMSNWLPFDLYSKISMSIGTSSMLAGISYYALFFMRDKFDVVRPHAGGWYTFAFMWVLQVGSVSLDLVLTRAEWIFAGCIILTAPLAMTIAIAWQVTWLIPVVFLTQGMWFWMLGLSALMTTKGWPMRWRASRFLNVLDSDQDGDPICRIYSKGQPAAVDEVVNVAQYLVRCTRAVLDLSQELSLQVDQIDSLRHCEESLSKALTLVVKKKKNISNRTGGCDGFWIQVRPSDSYVWVSAPGVGSLAEQGQSGTVDELIDAARQTAKALRVGSSELSEAEADNLRGYGGRAPASAREFEAQFRTKGLLARKNMGGTASSSFKLAVCCICAGWMFALIWSVVTTCRRCGVHMRTTNVTGEPSPLETSFLPMSMPRAWFAPVHLSCDHVGQRIVLGDGVRAYARSLTGESEWSGPLTGCSRTDVSGFSFGPNGTVLAVSARGGELFPLGAPVCDRAVAAHYLRESNIVALALDTGVDRFTTNTLGGLAIRDGKIMAMEGAPSGRLEMVGRLRVPEGHHWVGITLRDGHAMALDDKGALFELDVPSGNWSGPKAMHGNLFWRDICALSDGWLAVGQANGGEAQLHRFFREPL